MAIPEVNDLYEAFFERPDFNIVIPSFESKRDVKFGYTLIRGYASVKIYWSDVYDILVYEVLEPELTPQLKNLYSLISIGLQELLSMEYVKSEKSDIVRDFLDYHVRMILAQLGQKVSKGDYVKLMYYIFRDFIGLNQVEPLMRDPFIEDIECNGADNAIYITHRFFENMRTNISFSYENLVEFVEKLAQRCGRYISYAKPILDGALPDGSRVNATYTSDVTTKGPSFSIRKFTKDPWTPTRLIQFNAATPEMYAYLWLAVEHKFNIMVIGETSSGKTTFLNSITFFIKPEARIVSIEDTRELNLPHENWLPAVQREGFTTGAHGVTYGEVTLFDLLKASFRQNPDYVIVGEARGPEAYVMFQGMASGHPSMGTFHAGSVEMLLRRLESNPINLSPAMIQSLDLVLLAYKFTKGEKNVRRIKTIYELIEVLDEIGKANYNISFEWDPKTDTYSDLKSDYLLKRIEKMSAYSLTDLKREIELRAELLRAMIERKIFHYLDFARVVARYYADPYSVLKEFGVK
ncbi:MAG: type II/IV secretion system ATPase subunit [Candidatus Woesearchaeota archaeon]